MPGTNTRQEKTDCRKCDFAGCKDDPYCDSQWGSENLATQTATLCKKHSDELWERIQSLVKLNLVWYRIDRPGGLKTTSNELLTD